jgi:hypothetical protein
MGHGADSYEFGLESLIFLFPIDSCEVSVKIRRETPGCAPGVSEGIRTGMTNGNCANILYYSI